MNTIKFNNTEFTVLSYNKNTYFSGDIISSDASCSIITNDISNLNTMAQEPITTLQIYHNDTLIYNLQDINAHITYISEYLNDEAMSITINLTFDMQLNS